MTKETRYISFCKNVMVVAKTSNLPEYTRKYSPKKYKISQKITLLALKEYKKKL